MLNKILLKIKSEFILFVSFIVALISVFFVPISKDYVSYIDFKVLAVLFSLMMVIDGLQKHGFFTSFAHIYKLYVYNKRCSSYNFCSFLCFNT